MGFWARLFGKRCGCSDDCNCDQDDCRCDEDKAAEEETTNEDNA